MSGTRKGHHLLPMLLFFLGLLGWFGTANHVVIAQESDPVVQSDVEYAFGQEIRFSLQAENAAEVESLTLFVRPAHSSDVFAFEVSFAPGDTISVTHRIDVDQLNLRPYEHVDFSWQLSSPEGEFRLDEAEFLYNDDRFQWQQMSREGVTAYWTGHGPFFGQMVIDSARISMDRLANVISLSEIAPYDIYVYPSTADLRSGLRLAGLQGDSPTPELGVILVTAVNPQTAEQELNQNIPYQLTHLFLYRVAAQHYEQMPWWLKEGLAHSMVEVPNPRDEELLLTAISDRKTIPLSQLCAPPIGDGEREVLAAALSASVINHISDQFGRRELVDLIEAYARGADCRTGVVQVLDISMQDLNRDWLVAQEPRSPTNLFFQQYGLWLLLLAGSLGITALVIWQFSRV